jgi:hypothetical protein
MWTLDSRVELTAPFETGYAPTTKGRRTVEQLRAGRAQVPAAPTVPASIGFTPEQTTMLESN